MALEILRFIASITGALMFCSVGYYVACIYSAVKFIRRRRAARTFPGPIPPVSILKPLKDTDPEIYESFRSHCLQDVPAYEIIFGVSESDDPVLAEVEKLRREFPGIPIKLVMCNQHLGENRKVSNLVQMLSACSHEFLIINDSDIRVPRDYLRRVIAPVLDPKIGMVTCLYRGIAADSVGSRLEAGGISTDFAPGVLAAGELQGIRFGLGSTMALRRADLMAIGGFEPLLDYLADDYELGSRIAGLGLAVRLSECVVETFLPRYGMRKFLQHQLRWMRTIRESRPAGYLGLIFTFGVFWGVLTLAFSRGAIWAGIGLTIVAALRITVAIIVGRRILSDRKPSLWLAVSRDLISPIMWFMGLMGNTVHWRGAVFRLHHGKLVRMR